MRKRIVSLSFVIMFLVSLTISSFASSDMQKTNDVDITIKSGEFSLRSSDIKSFEDVILKDKPETYKTSFIDSFTVKDLRGTQAGWRVDVSATQFKSGNDVLPKAALSLEPVAGIKRVGTGKGVLPVAAQTSAKTIDEGTVTVLTAKEGTGMGVFDFSFNEDALLVIIDATTAKIVNDASANYVSTLTWDLVQAP